MRLISTLPFSLTPTPSIPLDFCLIGLRIRRRRILSLLSEVAYIHAVSSLTLKYTRNANMTNRCRFSGNESKTIQMPFGYTLCCFELFTDFSPRTVCQT